MIRINLLPTKKHKKREASQRQLVFMAMGVVATVGAAVFVQMQTEAQLEELVRKNRAFEADIDQLKKELGDYDKVKAQREELLKQRKTIQALETGRTGPMFLMREFSEILTKNEGPTFDRVTYDDRVRRDPNYGFNFGWEPRNLWIDSYDENNKQIKIRGTAKSNEDFAEFLKRLQVSVFFQDVRPEGTSQTGMAGLKLVSFNLSATVSY